MKQVAIAADQFINTLLGGWADETLSARVYRNRGRSWWWQWWYCFINAVFFWQGNHCRNSYTSEQLRRQLPTEYRRG